MAEPTAETPEITLRVNARKVSYGDFKKLVKVQKGEVDASEALEIMDKCLLDNVDEIPALDIVPALIGAINQAFSEGFKAKN